MIIICILKEKLLINKKLMKKEIYNFNGFKI